MALPTASWSAPNSRAIPIALVRMREDLFLLRDAARKADKPDAALAEAVDRPRSG
jgi:hypothetical protein